MPMAMSSRCAVKIPVDVAFLLSKILAQSRISFASCSQHCTPCGVGGAHATYEHTQDGTALFGQFQPVWI